MPGVTEKCPAYSAFFGAMGATAAVVFSGMISLFIAQSNLFLFCFLALGAAYGTAKSGCGISAMAVMRPEFIMKSVIPVVMAGIIAIYGLVVAVLIANSITPDGYGLYKYQEKTFLFVCLSLIDRCRAFLQLGAGLSVGLSGLAAGFAVGIVGDAGVRGTAQQPRFVDNHIDKNDV